MWLVGRLGQLLISCLLWRVLSDYIATTLETGSVSYSTFWVIYLRQESSIDAIYRLLSNRTFYRIFQSRVAIAFIVMSLTLILAFPTLTSAMTGYAASTESFVVEQETGSYARFAEFRPIA